MSRIKIITDSTSYLSKEFVEKENISVVQLNYVIDGISYKEGFKGEYDEFYEKLASTKLFSSTSQPSAGEFYEAYVEGLKNYDEIIVIVLSSKVSGTYNSAVLAKNMLEDKKITIIDTKTSASNLKFLVEDALQMVKDGKTSEEIKYYIEDKKEKMHVFLTVDTLEYLSRSGRLTSIQSMLGNLLNIKPIIKLKDGELTLIEKIRGKKKAYSTLIDKLPKKVCKIGICQILNIEEAEKMKEILADKFPNAIITIDELGPALGSHLGPKTLGLCFY